MTKQFLLAAAIVLFHDGCKPKKGNHSAAQSKNVGSLFLKTQFYDSSGNSTFQGHIKIWYSDSTAIEEIVSVNISTDTRDGVTVSYVPLFYRYIDLGNNDWYDYTTFSDTARILKSGTLPDSSFADGGWNFYVNNLSIEGQPEVLADTTIEEIKYRRIKFSTQKSKTLDSYYIGCLRCDNKAKLFSFEKNFTKQLNCAMTRYYQFWGRASIPYASVELEFLSDTLSKQELKVFQAWSDNQKKNPVN